MTETTKKQPIVQVEVLGNPGVGKSAIVCLINETLKKAGFETEVTMLDGDADYVTSQLPERLNALTGKNTKIVINETTKCQLKDRLNLGE